MIGKAKTIDRYKGAIEEYIKELERYRKRAEKARPNLKIIVNKPGNKGRNRIGRRL